MGNSAQRVREERKVSSYSALNDFFTDISSSPQSQKMRGGNQRGAPIRYEEKKQVQERPRLFYRPF
jgi:hypothetical protein